MKYKKVIIRTIVILLIIAISVLFAFIISFSSNKIQKSIYPRNYSEYVTECSDMYSVPEYVIYATIKCESDFNSSALSNAGAIGLMQITPDTFTTLNNITEEGFDTGMLYDPYTNIKYGTFYLSILYLKYSDWETSFAAYNAGETNVDEWLNDPEITSDEGKLVNIPFSETKQYVSKMEKTTNKYKKLYYSVT